MKTIRRHSLVIYSAIWALVLLLVPMEIGYHYLAGQDAFLNWTDVGDRIVSVVPFFLLFLSHHFLLLPLLGRPGSVWKGVYSLFLILLLLAFSIYCFRTTIRPPGALEQQAPPDGLRPFQPEVMRSMIGVLVIVADIGVAAFLRSLEDERRMQELRDESLRQQMETLRYQINPHFFMNTLNNIHALVDIDGEKAKESIEIFSKMLRIVLYEGDSPTIPLVRELDLIRYFVSLMRLRYPPSVSIVLDLPQEDAGAVIPPLSLTSVVENAFKHGISYKRPSYIHLSVKVEENRIRICCCNSLHDTPAEQCGGIGMENLRRRFDLLYGSQSSILIREKEGEYELRADVPAKVEAGV